MKTWIRRGSVVTVALLGVTTLGGGAGVAWAQRGPTPDRNQPAAAPGSRQCPPQKITGRITALDPANDTVTVQASDGTTRQFKASREDMQTFKVGDSLDMTLRSAPNC